MKKKKNILPILILCCTLLPLQAFTAWAAGTTLPASIPAEKVKIGKTVQIKTKQEGVSYESSDTSIATVNSQGRVTGKKQGTAVISAKKKGYKAKKFSITVIANGRYPAIPVSLDEAGITLETGSKKLQAVVQNYAVEGSIRKIVYEYQAVVYHLIKTEETDTTTPGAVSAETTSPGAVSSAYSEPEPQWEKEKKNIKFTLKNIRAGYQKKAVVKGDFGDKDKLELTLKSVKLYTGKMLLTYAASKDKVSVDWGTLDKTAPVISGWVGSSSYNSKDVYMVVYPDKKYDFTKYVKAVDDRDGTVTVKADTSGLNWKKKGVYNIVFTATDKAGNTAKKRAKVQVRTVGMIEEAADGILASIIRDSWTDKAKAEAIYRYVRRNYSYVDSNDHASWENSALYGLRYHSGNCFVFYSVSRLLLTRCGIPNIEVTRSAGSRHGHWWNYVYVQDGWYHFDTTPRRILATFCLVTDAQLTGYSNSAGNSHIWNKSLLPAGATKPISQVQWGRRY